MIAPNTYELSNKLKEIDLYNHGFDGFARRYVIRRWLYKKIIYLEIEIDFSNKVPTMRYGVYNHDTKQYFTPFYHSEERYNNYVYDEVVANYNRYMDGLCACNIMWRRNYFPKRRRMRRYKNVG